MGNYYNKQNYPPKEKQEFKEILPAFDVKDLNRKNYVNLAEKVIKEHFENEKKKTITTNQIRNLLELTNELRERLRTERVEQLTEDMISQVQYIKLRFVYAVGRDKGTQGNDGKGVLEFMKRSNLIACLDTVKDSPEQYLLVCKYMEALVAYHKFFDSEKKLKAELNKNHNRRN
ncbi:MAG: type III-A CRISPR-associated protein Csm2 [Oscillospiraceae bacterium]|nr:type III-A CRISPR-associated protein Csm2 [Oscillospiraceae bacterium]MBR1530391.1 type III-A CRISPR-associated protein Csm2 [Oscillospiraceae bacterium]